MTSPLHKFSSLNVKPAVLTGLMALLITQFHIVLFQSVDVETSYGNIQVAIQGDRTKPAIFTFHDIGLNRKYCVGVGQWKKLVFLILKDFSINSKDLNCPKTTTKKTTSKTHINNTKIQSCFIVIISCVIFICKCNIYGRIL